VCVVGERKGRGVEAGSRAGPPFGWSHVLNEAWFRCPKAEADDLSAGRGGSRCKH
jgi:hypothetical protein